MQQQSLDLPISLSPGPENRPKFLERLKPIVRSIRYGIRKHVVRNADVFDEWFHDRGDETLILEHSLDSDSVVFEVGGYKGNWSSKIISRYNPNIYIFEPVRTFHQELVARFKDQPKVRTYHYGLSDGDERIEFGVHSDASGQFAPSSSREFIDLKDICAVVVEHHLSEIYLIQINIEGSEYRLLDRMIESRLTECCRIIQVQFHKNVPDAEARRNKIRNQLSETHTLIYDYPFVWEAWKRKGAAQGAETKC